MQRGFTLVEMAIAVGILALLLLCGVAFALGTHPFAMRSAASQFDAQLQAARALAASSGNGATIVVQPVSNGGFKSILYGGRPTGLALRVSNTSPIVSDATHPRNDGRQPPVLDFHFEQWSRQHAG